MAITTSFTFMFRRGTAAQWNLQNPILNTGEPGVESDTNKMKLGNGLATWSALPYLISDSGGTPGPKGDPGDQGTPGVAGAAGLSAYATAVATGYVGTQAQWIASMNPKLVANIAPGSVIAIVKVGSVWPPRGTSRTDVIAFFIGQGADPADMQDGDVRLLF